jgi:hypothetical protein
VIAFIKLPRVNQSPITIGVKHIVCWFKYPTNFKYCELVTSPGIVYNIDMPEEDLTNAILTVLRGGDDE